ncbi:MAG: deoxyribonuclease V [Sedimentisphaerales bacterium]|nr:deoxyribonuclease V [Sedimentisphaerales bacterium]
MKIKRLHNWNLSYKEAVELQRRLAGQVRHTKLEKRPKIVAGLDCAFSKDGKKIIAAVVVLRLPELEVIETANAAENVKFPYIPGLLSFREAPVCISAVEKIKNLPDLFIIDGQGIAHPRRLGLAAHLGLFFDMPTIGCAKSRLTGSFEEPQSEKGAYTWLEDGEEIIGAVVRTRTNVKPVFISVGHQCRLDSAINITFECTTRYRLPEPTRLAHQFVSKLKLNI